MATDTKWFVEAYGHTNEVVGLRLREENFHEHVLCDDDVERPLWDCGGYGFIGQLLKSESSGQLVFKVFKSEGSGKPKLWLFLRKKKRDLKGALKKGTVRKGGTPSMNQ